MGGLCTKSAPLGPCGEGAAGLYDIPETRGRWHEHCIDVGFAEEWCRSGDGGQYVDFGGLMQLALVAGGNVLLNISSKRRPPKPVQEGM